MLSASLNITFPFLPFLIRNTSVYMFLSSKYNMVRSCSPTPSHVWLKSENTLRGALQAIEYDDRSNPLTSSAKRITCPEGTRGSEVPREPLPVPRGLHRQQEASLAVCRLRRESEPSRFHLGAFGRRLPVFACGGEFVRRVSLLCVFRPLLVVSHVPFSHEPVVVRVLVENCDFLSVWN